MSEKKKRVALTGGASFPGLPPSATGSWPGYHVIAMDNLITGSLQNIEHLGVRQDFEFTTPT
jgi:dTDP-glucose 4,6-dehydratase